MELEETRLLPSTFRELCEFAERGLLLLMGSIATGAWAIMLMRLLSDFHPIFELATHPSLHVFLGLLAVLMAEVLFFMIRRRSTSAGPRWKRRLGFTLVPLIFFGWVTTPWRLLPLRNASTNADSLTVLSWNLLLVNRNHQAVLDLVQREQPDIIALIELSPWMAKELEPLRIEYPFGMWLPAWQGSGIGLLSRVPGSNFRTIYPANTWMPAIEMEIRREEKEKSLSLLAVHTVSPDAGDGSRTTFRDEQLKVLGNWAADRKNAAMIIGDLNVTPWSPPFWRLLEQGRLVDSSWYRGYFPSWPTVLQQAGIPIDHALVNAKIQVLDRRNVYHRSNSDHYPILITIQ